MSRWAQSWIRGASSSVLILGIVAIAPGQARADVGLGRHKQLYAVPAPGKVTIDGKLDDWDLSGQIEMYVVSETKDVQSAKFALMYDHEALYLSGVVRDLSPMMNRHDPRVTGDKGWDADACQFRLTLDPSQAYPVPENQFMYSGANHPKDTRDDLRHLTLWYYTDRAEPCLQMHMGMSYRLPRPEWAPFGVVPSDLFEAKYVKAEDGRGYTFEYRIPWSTLGARAPLKGGDIVAGTVQFNWGAQDGLKTGGGSAWAYDGMSGPGFTFQNAAVWGKLIFADRGHLPRDLVEAGVPTEKPLPLKFAYDLPEDGQITLQLFDQDHLARRILVAQGDRHKGPNIELWDGMDDEGKPLAAGTYACKGIIHQPIQSEFLFSAHNSGQPPYPTDDGKGGWGGDHGCPTACSAVPGGMLLSWNACEYGWGIIKVDLQGRKQWGSKACATVVANDGNRFYTSLGHGVSAFEIADGRPVNFGSGSPSLTPPPGGDAASDTVAGLACGGGKIYVSYPGRNLIGIYDSASGRLETTWQVAAPGAIAPRLEAGLVAISQGKLVEVVNGRTAPLNDQGLDNPAGVAVAANGEIFVSNAGIQQDIAVFAPSGKLLRRIGKAGGRPAVGDYDPSGVYMPGGLAIDESSRLWVAEQTDGPKRISVWDTGTGAFEREFFGGSSYFGYAYINPAVPDEIYCHNVLWHIDWDKRTTTPISTIWRKTAPEMIEEPNPDGYQGLFRSLTAANGRQYALANGRFKSILYRRDGNIFRPFLATFNISRGWSLWGGLGIPELDDPAKFPDGGYIWQDANGDGLVQTSEVHRFPYPQFKAIDRNLAIWTTGGALLKPVKWLENGQPVYDPEKTDKSFLAGTPNANAQVWLDPDGSVYTYGGTPSLAKWSADGKLVWGYPHIVEWRDALSLPLVKAGVLHGMTGGLGVAGSFTGNMSYFGPCHLFEKDGIYAAAVMRDGRTGGLGPDIGQPEGQGGELVSVITREGTAPRTLLLAGGQDGRVTEIHGLDTVKPLPAWDFTLSTAEVSAAAQSLADYNLRNGRTDRLAIADGRNKLDTAGSVSKSLDGARRFTARAARDDKNVYLRFDVIAPNELINAISDPKLVFKGGNCLDIQIGCDPAADPKRKAPVPGDLRLLVTQQSAPDGKAVKPYAVIFRPMVRNFKGQPIVLRSPTGQESFDEITVVDNVGLDYRKTPDGFTAVVTIPLEAIGLAPRKGQAIRMDLGYLYGNATGTQIAARSYWMNNSFSANVVNDVPNESRLEPEEWGLADE